MLGDLGESIYTAAYRINVINQLSFPLKAGSLRSLLSFLLLLKAEQQELKMV